MRRQGGMRQPARTLLEQLIRDRQLTFEEFAEYAENYARDKGEPGTLSVRHLQRLVAGRGPDGRPLGPLRPATARLLQLVFDESVEDLLAPPDRTPDASDATHAERRTAQLLRVAIAVVVRESDVLMVCRRENNESAISWQFPAGIVKPGIPPERVAVQETLAETAVHCTVQRGLGRRLHPITKVVCEYMLCNYLAGDAENLDSIENAGVAWVDKAKLTCFVPTGQIFSPVLDAIQAPSPLL